MNNTILTGSSLSTNSSGTSSYTGSATLSLTASSSTSGANYAIGLTAGYYLGSGSTFIGYSSSKVKYFILDEYVEVDGYSDPTTALYLSMINMMGKPFYDDVKKQGVKFPAEIEKYLEKKIISWNRNKKIDTIL